MALVKGLRDSGKLLGFSSQLQNYHFGMGDSLQSFTNTFIIGCFKDPARDFKNELSIMIQSNLLFLGLRPLLNRPNVILEQNLTQEEKKKFLIWAKSEPLMADCAFLPSET
jgi:hypothetical protein